MSSERTRNRFRVVSEFFLSRFCIESVSPMVDYSAFRSEYTIFPLVSCSDSISSHMCSVRTSRLSGVASIERCCNIPVRSILPPCLAIRARARFFSRSKLPSATGNRLEPAASAVFALEPRPVCRCFQHFGRQFAGDAFAERTELVRRAAHGGQRRVGLIALQQRRRMAGG